MRTHVVRWLVVLFFSFVSANGYAEWMIGGGYANVSGLSDIESQFKDNLESDNFEVVEESSAVPVGLVFQSYYSVNDNFAVGAGFGPVFGFVTSEKSFLSFPAHIDVKASYKLESNYAPYLIAGTRTFLNTGDYIEGSNPGFFAGLGVMYEAEKFFAGIELVSDSSSLDVENRQTGGVETFEPMGSMIRAYFLFRISTLKNK